MADGAIVDPVCGRTVDPLRARAVGIFGGQTRYFCSAACKAAFATPGAQPLVEALPPKPAPPTKPAPPKPIVAAMPATPVPAARPFVPPTERVPALDPPPRPNPYVAPFGIAFVVIAGLGTLAWVRHRPARPVAVVTPAPMPVVVTPPVVTPPVPVPAPAPDVAAVPAYDASLKLGLRRFVDRSADGVVWSDRLLLIDDSGTPTIVTVASAKGDATGEMTEGAVAPEADFARTRHEPGVVFKDALQTSTAFIEIEVERRATDLVVRSRSGEGAVPWTEKIVARLTDATALRAAPFARGRYAEK